jgi:ubiquinone/menaquinone biosynthesis C-methylase UbiE
MLEWLGPKEVESILDVACGRGTLSLKIAEKGCEVYGVDLSEDAIDSERLAEREKIACEFKVGSAEDLPYPDGYFDKIVCSR